MIIGGLLCLVRLAQDTTQASHVFSSPWSILAQRAPALQRRMSSRGAGRTARSRPLGGPRRHHHDRAGFPAGVLVAERPY